jgi:hypothetical protein
MEAMKCNNLLYVPIVDYFMITGYKRIDFNCVTSDQHHTKCVWNSVVLSYFKIGSFYLLELYDWRAMEAMKCNNLLDIPIVDYFMIAGYKRIDLNCLTSDQHYTKCLWHTVFLLRYYFKIGSLHPWIMWLKSNGCNQIQKPSLYTY